MREKDELFMMRRNKKIKLQQVADYIGCSVPTLSNYENDRYDLKRIWKDKYREFIMNY